MNRILYMESENRELVRGIGSARGNTGRQCIHSSETKQCRYGQEQEVRLILNRKQGQDLIASKFEQGMEVPGDLGSCVEVTIVGAMTQD